MQFYPLKAPATYPGHHLLVVAFAIAIVFGLYPFASLVLQQNSYGFAISGAAPDFELRDAEGKPRSLADYRGRHVYLMFGFMRCQETCHSQVMNLVALADQLDRTEIEFLYLAMDTRYDEPALLKEYFDRRGKSFTSLHAQNLQQMQSIASAFNAGYRIAGNPGSDNYDIEHPARIFLIDPEGQLRFMYSGTTIDVVQIAADFHQINRT